VLSDGSTVRSRYVPTKRADVAAGLVSVRVSLTPQHTATHCRTLHADVASGLVSVCVYFTLPHTATTATHRYTPQHTATHSMKCADVAF